jgi:hypothetical protein
MSRHEEVEERNQRKIDIGKQGLFLNPLKPVIAHVGADNGAVFLFNEAVVILLLAAASCKGDMVIFTPYFRGIINKFRTIITVKFQNRENGGGSDVRQGLESPLLGVIEEGTQFDPA